MLEQGTCATCVNAAITSVVESAIASAAGTSAQDVRLSPTYAYYCKPDLTRGCASGWTFADALEGMAADAARFLPDETCTSGFDLEGIRSSNPAQMGAACAAIFNTCPTSKEISGCNYNALTEFWEIQRAIRMGGAVLTRINVTPEFVDFFSRNPRGVYSGDSSSSDAIAHAVVLVSIYVCLEHVAVQCKLTGDAVFSAF